MSAPLLYGCYFGLGLQRQWPRLARVLVAAATRHCPEWTVRVDSLPPPKPVPRASPGHVANTHKLDRWCEVIAGAAAGDRVLLVDVDTVVLRSLAPIWDQTFDVAYTIRPDGTRFPINAGVVAVQVNPRSRAFLTAWRDENRRMLADPARHLPWRKRYGGINQSALGAVLASPAARQATLVQLPCVEWNCEDSTWASFDPAVTRILHVKSQLRLAIFQGVSGAARWKSLIAIWRAHERALDAGPRTA